MSPLQQLGNKISQTPIRRGLRILVYVMLVSSAATAFLLDEALWRRARDGTLPEWTPLIPAVLFTAFVLVFILDRWALVRRHAYPLGRAFFQVAFALVFLSLLWPQQAKELRRLRHDGDDELEPHIAQLLTHREARVRAAACELVRYRNDTSMRRLVQQLAEEDGSGLVREECRRTALSLESPQTPPP